MTSTDFTAFNADLFDFLTELKANNDRDWFNAQKDRYERSVREPALAFIRAMGSRIARVTDSFTADDRKVGGSLMKIHRDVRFSEDKAPYKTNVGIQLRHRAGKDVHAPGFYVHLAPGEVFIGVGIWHPDPKALTLIRARIDAEQDQWTELVNAPDFKRLLKQGGDSLSRPPRGFRKDHPLLTDLLRKDHIVSHDLTERDALSPDFPDTVDEIFVAAAPYCRFLCEALNLSF